MMPEPEAAVAIVHARAPEDAVLLMRRTERADDSWSGHWSCPGGRRDEQDSDLLQTALRELEEECGIRLRRDNLEAELPHRIARRAEPPYLVVAPFVFRVDRHLPTVLNVGEAAEAMWVPLSILRDPARHAWQSVPGRPPDVHYPGVLLNRTPLWGFTYKLLMDWLEIPELPLAPAAQSH
jgi:8-oxo-dGTP pyrophosphatase MutT (NUDIX family)